MPEYKIMYRHVPASLKSCKKKIAFNINDSDNKLWLTNTNIESLPFPVETIVHHSVRRHTEPVCLPIFIMWLD